MSEGYLFCVGGDELYYKLLTRAILTLRQFDTDRPICVMAEHIAIAKIFCPFENIQFVTFRIENHLVPNVDPNNKWHRFGFYPKVFQFMYTPFKKTMFFDVDYVFKTDIKQWWDHFDKSGVPILIAGLADECNCSPPDWQWGWIYSMIQKSGICIPQVCSSFMIYDKQFLKVYLKHINTILSNLEKWGCRPQYCGGYPDEIIFGMLLGLLEIRPDKMMFDWMVDETKVLSCDKNV
jgi:hypothetical protein